jgi:hypothetical protein
MMLIALGEDEVINLESIASATIEDSNTRIGPSIKLTVTFVAGQNATFSGDDAKALWKALRDKATEPSAIPNGPQLTTLNVPQATSVLLTPATKIARAS